MTRQSKRERRWIVLAEDGRHASVGRHTDPTEAELASAADYLRSSGLGGWLAVMEGDYFSHGKLSVMLVRELAPTRVTWEMAIVAFYAERCRQCGR